jgi:hypothetical protein
MAGVDSKLTPKLIDELAHHIRRGVAIKYACPACGIHRDTFHRWMVRGEKDKLEGLETPHSMLFDTISKVRTDFIQEAIENIKKAGRTNKNWQANTWLLERLYSAAYGKDSEDVQKLSRDIDEIKRILGGEAEPSNYHNDKED